MAENVLYCDGTFDVLRRCVADGSVDLIYLDPPFNSNATYSLVLAEQYDERAVNQIGGPSRQGGIVNRRAYVAHIGLSADDESEEDA